MASQPQRKRPQTVTRNTLAWKLLEESEPPNDALGDTAIQILASTHAIDEEILRELSRRLRPLLSPELKLSQPELSPARRKAGQKKLARANDLIRSAEAKMREASRILGDVGFSNSFAHVGLPNPANRHLKEFEAAITALQECSQFFKVMEKNEQAQWLLIPDVRKAFDVRRTIVCVTIFNLWLDLERKLTYTSDPVSGERTGPLIEFINDVVQHLTFPPERLSGQAIKRELDDFLNR